MTKPFECIESIALKVLAHDAATLCEAAFEQSSELHPELLRIFLRYIVNIANKTTGLPSSELDTLPIGLSSYIVK